MSTHDGLAKAAAHSAYLKREPAEWWDDEHVFDNGHSALVIDRLIDELRAVTTERDAFRNVVRHLLAGDEPPREGYHWRDTDTPVTPAEADAIRAALLDGPADTPKPRMMQSVWPKGPGNDTVDLADVPTTPDDGEGQ